MKLGWLVSPLLALVLCTTAGCTAGDASSKGSGPMTFVPAAPPEGTSVFLRSLPPNVLVPNQLAFDVVARGAADLHGAAFRVTWDSAALGFLEAKSGAPWSKKAVALAKEGSPGELAVVWAERGEAGIDASGETVLGTLVFEVRGRTGTALAFKSERSQLVDKTGMRVAATFAGGQLGAR
jgi:hypothetical protein